MAIYRDEQGNIISRKSPVSGSVKRSEAQKRANRKYDAEHYKTIGSKVKTQYAEFYKELATQYGITVGKLITNCINYCVNNNIDLSGDIKINLPSDTNSPDETD